MRALQVRHNVRRFGAARLLSVTSPKTSARIAPVDLRTVDDPAKPAGSGWVKVRTRLSGICGSDLALIDGHASTYFEDFVSFPFIPGHEIVGELESGQRVVIEPVLGHAARGAVPPWESAAPADGDDYAHLVRGHLKPGIQTGFCCSTGGGWAPWFWAHDSQIHLVPDDMSDETAVLIEPLAGSVHAAVMAAQHTNHHLTDTDSPIIAVLGAGTMGLGAIAALRGALPNARIIAGARYPHQIRFAKGFGADVVAPGDEISRAVRRMSGAHRIGASLSSGAHATINAVGDSSSIAMSINITRPRGAAVLLGMPGDTKLDLTPLWHREVALLGAYTYGTEQIDGNDVRTFDLATALATRIDAERLLSATYRLDQHVEALAHAAAAGRRGAVKIAFDQREDQ